MITDLPPGPTSQGPAPPCGGPSFPHVNLGGQTTSKPHEAPVSGDSGGRATGDWNECLLRPPECASVREGIEGTHTGDDCPPGCPPVTLKLSHRLQSLAQRPPPGQAGSPALETEESLGHFQSQAGPTPDPGLSRPQMGGCHWP